MYDLLCAGCGHKTAMGLIDEIIKENNLANKTIISLDVACCSLLIDYIDYDSVMCPHGRVLPVSLGIKYNQKQKIIISYMGDGAAYSIGLSHLIHSAYRNDDIFAIVINNGFFAMTGGQKSPTNIDNNPMLIEKMISDFKISYFARSALSDKENINLSKKYLFNALDKYIKKGGFNMVELLSPCPTNYKTDIKTSMDFINQNISKIYKTGEIINERAN